MERSTQRRIGASAALLACAALPMSVGAQSNINLFADAPISHFTQEDLDLQFKTGIEVLESGKKGKARSWSNDRTGNGGRIELLASFTSTDDRKCGRVKVDTRAGEMTGSARYTLCQNAEGQWMVDSGAKPKPRV
jgi:hypothetical protein